MAQPVYADNWVDFTGAGILRDFVSDTSAEIDLRPGVTAVGQYNADGTAQIAAWGETFDRTWEVVGEDQVCYTALDEINCFTFEQNLDVPGEYRARNVETGKLIVFHVSETETAVASSATASGFARRVGVTVRLGSRRRVVESQFEHGYIDFAAQLRRVRWRFPSSG